MIVIDKPTESINPRKEIIRDVTSTEAATPTWPELHYEVYNLKEVVGNVLQFFTFFLTTAYGQSLVKPEIDTGRRFTIWIISVFSSNML